MTCARTVSLSKSLAHPHPHVQTPEEENRKPCLEKQAVPSPHLSPLWQDLTAALPRSLVHFPTLGELNQSAEVKDPLQSRLSSPALPAKDLTVLIQLSVLETAGP